MANFFDQFDEQPQVSAKRSAPPSAPAGNFFDQFDEGSPASAAPNVESFDGMGTATEPSPKPKGKQAEMRAYDPTFRDRIATFMSGMIDDLGGNSKSPEWQRIVSGLVGSTGLGANDVGVIDFTPARIPLAAQEAKRNFEAGNYGHAALDAVAALPAPAVSKVVDTGVNAVTKGIEKVANMRPGATGPVAEAADKLDVKIPAVAAYGDSTLGQGVQNLAGKITTVPFVGAPLTKATRAALDDLEGAADTVTSKYLQKGNAPLPSPEDAAPAPVGDTVKSSLTSWIKGKGSQDSPQLLERVYKTVDQRVPNNITSPLPNTTAAVQRLLAKDTESFSDVSAPAIAQVTAAINEPAGLSFKGMKDLRTNIGAMIDDGLLPNAGTVKPALKQIYAGLTADLDATVAALGGKGAVRAWDFAESVARRVADRREQLAKIIGSDGTMNAEGVVDRLVRYAGSQSTADLEKLTLARKTMGDTWDDVSASAIQRLGRNQANDFDLGQFTKRYEALSTKGRNVLFASTAKRDLKDDLDALSVLGTKFKMLQSYLNHSGTGGTVSVLGAMTAVANGGMAGIGAVLASAVGGNGVARWLARPANLKATVRLGNGLYEALSKSKGGNTAKLALVNFARHVAADTGEDEADILARMNNEEPRPGSSVAKAMVKTAPPQQAPAPSRLAKALGGGNAP